MATTNDILRQVPDLELKQAAAEALEWNRTGLLQGEMLRGIAKRLLLGTGLPEDQLDPAMVDNELRDTDTLVCREAARRLVEAEDPLSRVAKWLAFTAPEVHAAFLREFNR